MIVPALLAVLALPQAVAPPPPSTETTVTIEARGPTPPFGSGLLFVTFWVNGRNDDGQTARHYVLYMGEAQPLPPVGARCTFHSEPAQIDFVGGETSDFREPHPAVVRYECGDIRFSA